MTPPVAAALQAAPAPSTDASAASGGPPGLGGAPPGFASVLDDHVARTAVAEGQTKSAGGSAPAANDAAQPATDAAQDLAATVAAGALTAQAPTPQPQTAPSPTPTPSLTDTPTRSESPAEPEAASPMLSAPDTQPASTAPATPPAATAPAILQPTQPTQATQPAPSPAATTTPTTDTAPASQPQQSQSDSHSQSNDQSQQQPPAPATTHAVTDAASVAPTTAPASPQATQATQAAESATPTRYGVSLQHAVEAVRTTIELGAKQGAVQARIELSPPSLGTIRIQLHRTDDGVTAHVVTDNAATADTLAQGGDDLRRSLESAGLTLLRLNIEARGEGAQTQDRGQDSAPRSTQGTNEIDAGDSDPGQAQTTTLVLPGGALVNVLA